MLAHTVAFLLVSLGCAHPILLTTRAAAPSVRAAGPPHLPLQVACLVLVEMPLPTASLYLVGAPADGLSACRRTQLCPCSTSCRPSTPAAASCLPRSSRGVSARCRSLFCWRASWQLVHLSADPAWPSFDKLFLQMICKFEVRWLPPARSCLCPVRSCPASECCATPVSFETRLPFL